MIRLDRYHQALPLYHGAYAQKCDAITNILAQLPGLHIADNRKVEY